MNFLVADHELLYRLRGIVEPVEIRDASGKVLGQFIPAVSPEELAAYERAKEGWDLEAAERELATNRDKGRPLKEIMEELQSPKKKGCATP